MFILSHEKIKEAIMTAIYDLER